MGLPKLIADHTKYLDQCVHRLNLCFSEKDGVKLAKDPTTGVLCDRVVRILVRMERVSDCDPKVRRRLHSIKRQWCTHFETMFIAKTNTVLDVLNQEIVKETS